MQSLFHKLAPGDRRTIGAVNEIVTQALQKPALIKALVAGLNYDHPGIRMRSADALEKIGAIEPGLLQPYKESLIKIGHQSSQQEVQWHLAQIFAYLDLTPGETRSVFQLLSKYYHQSPSQIVKVFSLTTLVHLSQRTPTLTSKSQTLLTQASRTGSPAVKSRAKKLLLAYT